MEAQPILGPAVTEPLTRLEATIEASRCLYCYDAPCITACPTGIDIPGFINRIVTGDLAGSARTIMDANPVGASCARVCPTEQLCEGACVYTPQGAPVKIGSLQRYATDWLIEDGRALFTAGEPTGKRVAIIGSGPAGLSAARELARSGHAVVIFERDALAGGLDTYGIVPFRLPEPIALWEVEEVRRLGVDIRTGVEIDAAGAPQLLAIFDAIVIAAGMGNVPRMNIENEDARGVWDALEFIRLAKTTGRVPSLGNRVAIIGGGNTAIDAATTSRRLGARSVTMFYRRGEERMTAYRFEIDFARHEGVEFRFFTLPARVIVNDGAVAALELVRTESDGSAKPIAGSEFRVEADTIVRAIGQTKFSALLDAFGVAHDAGVARVDAMMRTSVPNIFAAGDVMFRAGSGDAMVVEAAQRGKTAARSIDALFGAV